MDGPCTSKMAGKRPSQRSLFSRSSMKLSSSKWNILLFKKYFANSTLSSQISDIGKKALKKLYPTSLQQIGLPVFKVILSPCACDMIAH